MELGKNGGDKLDVLKEEVRKGRDIHEVIKDLLVSDYNLIYSWWMGHKSMAVHRSSERVKEIPQYILSRYKLDQSHLQWILRDPNMDFLSGFGKVANTFMAELLKIKNVGKGKTIRADLSFA